MDPWNVYLPYMQGFFSGRKFKWLIFIIFGWFSVLIMFLWNQQYAGELLQLKPLSEGSLNVSYGTFLLSRKAMYVCMYGWKLGYTTLYSPNEIWMYLAVHFISL
jgi:hypothetical protein